MKSNSNFLQDFFLKFSGEDFQMINRSNTANAFVGIGVFVFLIFLTCCISGFSFLYNAFQGNILLSVPIGIFWGLLIAVIYVFLIYTITPILLPTPVKKKAAVIGEVKPLVFDNNISFFLRYAFIIFLSIIVAQPLNVLVLKKSSQRSLERYKIEYKLNEILSSDSSFVKKETEYRNKFEERIKILNISDSVSLRRSYQIIEQKVNNDVQTLAEGTSYKNQLEKLKILPFSKKNQQKFDDLYSNIETLLSDEKKEDDDFLDNIGQIDFNNSYLKNDFETYKIHITTVIKEKKEHYEKLENLINKSNFYITTMKIILKENPLSWFIILFAIFLFSYPIYQKYRIGKKTSFFKTKQHLEISFVEKNYNSHLTQYGIKLQKKLESLNQESEKNIFRELEKLKKYSPLKYENMLSEIQKEINDVFEEKYQFWKNPPFRTQKAFVDIKHKSEKEFLELIYQDKKEE